MIIYISIKNGDFHSHVSLPEGTRKDRLSMGQKRTVPSSQREQKLRGSPRSLGSITWILVEKRIPRSWIVIIPIFDIGLYLIPELIINQLGCLAATSHLPLVQNHA